MKFIESYVDANSKKSIQYLFNVKGSITQDQNEKVWAKSVDIELGQDKIQKQYYIRVYNNVPLDPLGPESRRDIWQRTELKSVSAKTFDYYVMYLRSKNNLYMTRTQRSFIDGQ